ncbi:MAG: hypothetical protein D6775_05650 [Caldilineae bacterium]|nr:MAG: hypothetical protein D6775_05650 [Caldilineae bacterium]
MATHKLEGEVMPGAVAAGALVCVPLSADEEAAASVVAWDLKQKRERWRHTTPEAVINPPLVQADSLVLVVTQSRDPLGKKATLCALGQEEGEPVWCWSSGMRALSAPCPVGERVWLVGDRNTLWSVGLKDGEVSGPVEIQDLARHIAAPAAAAGHLFIPARNGQLVALDLESRQVVWRYRHQSRSWSGTPIVVGATVITPFTDGHVIALDLDTGALRWQQRLHAQVPALAGDGDRVFAGYHRGVVALNAEDGKVLWEMPSERRVSAPPTVYGDMVLVAGHDHLVRGLRASDGEELWRWQGDRRFETPPLLTPEGLALLDAGDKLTVLRVPLSSLPPPEALTAKPWRVEATQLARAGKVREAAAMLEEKGDFFAAAELWAAAGEEDRAVPLCEQADTELGWQKAAAIYRRRDDVVAMAIALQRLAELRDDADAWDAARRAYQEAGMRKEAAACWREICRLRKYPFIRIEVEPDAGFVKGQYNTIRLKVTNEGYGVAYMLSARASGPFGGEDMQSQAIGNLAPGHSTELELALIPEVAGRVPLHLEVSFLLQRNGELHTVSAREIVPVASTAALSQPAAELRETYNAAFDVASREDFRRSSNDIMASYRRQLEDIGERLAAYREYQARYGMLAPPEIGLEIRRMEEEKVVLERKLDALLAETGSASG